MVISAAISGFITALIISLVLVGTKKIHGRFTLDSDSGVQKMHKSPTPRIGGVALAAGFLACWLTLEGETKSLFGLIGIAGIPALFFGLAEDITKKVNVRTRLIATIVSGLCFAFLTSYTITHIEIWGFDALLALPLIALAFTAFAIAGVANAINLIDGFHGLASGTLCLILLSFAVVGWRVGDDVLVSMSLLMAAIIAGFFVVNFPLGKLFLGDAGAYFAGYFVAVLAVMLPARNPEVSPWISLLILGYPVTETIVSIIRRVFDSQAHPGEPDSAHLHHVIFRTWALRVSNLLHIPKAQNALTSLIMWFLPVVTLTIVAFCGLQTLSALLFFALVAVLYVSSYRSIRTLDPAY